MAPRSFSELDLASKRVLLRADLDVPLTPAGGLTDTDRLDAAARTMRQALDRGARLVVAGHMGAPLAQRKNRQEPPPSLEVVGSYLAEKLGRDVILADEPAGDGARKVVGDLREGQIVLLENLHLAPGEVGCEETFALALASYCDVFISDAFCTLHHRWASTTRVARHVSEFATGPLVERELANLVKLTTAVAKPYVAAVGGIGFGSKLPFLEKLLTQANTVLLGGSIGNTFVRARGGNTGRSLTDEDKLPNARSMIRKAGQAGGDLRLPQDVVAAAGIRATDGRIVQAAQVPDEGAALDIGPETVRNFAEVFSNAHTILLAGPMGACETAEFATGTIELARAMSRVTGAFTVAIGAETTRAIRSAGLADRFSHVSMGDRAALEYLRGAELPGLVALEP
jgi:phosphoglycerate kinase